MTLKRDAQAVLDNVRLPPDDCGPAWTMHEVTEIMVTKLQANWSGYSYQDWYEKLLENRLRKYIR